MTKDKAIADKFIGEKLKEFEERFTFGGRTGVVAFKTDNAYEVAKFMKQALSDAIKYGEENCKTKLKEDLQEEEEIIIEDCENCGNEGYGKAWYGHGQATGDAWGDRYTPTGSVVFCKDCSLEFKIGKEWDGERIWKVTSEMPEHENIRLNHIKKKDLSAVYKNQLRKSILAKLTTSQEEG